MFPRALQIAGMVVALGAVIAGAAFTFLGGDAVYSGVKVDAIDLGGLSIEQAENRLAERATDLANERLALRYAGETLKTTIAELGGEVDISASVRAAYRIGREGNPFRRITNVVSARRRGCQVPAAYAIDRTAALAYLRAVAEKIDCEPVNARPAVEDKAVRMIPDKVGIRLDVEKSMERIVRAVDSGARNVDLAIVTAAPKVTVAHFKGIDGVLATYSTPYNAWERNRTHNLRIACDAINATLIEAGGTFSYNAIVGPRLRKHGFRDAPIFVRGEVEPGTGGGVCQVSTTVYNAALLANMKIVQRSHHSRPVVYAPVGRDATVAYPTIDLKFENTTGNTVYILASVKERTVNVSILGRKRDDQQIEIVAAGHRVIRAPVITRVEEDIEPGKSVVRRSGRQGHRISTYRIVKLGGKAVRRELISNDYYSPESRIVAVPQPELQPEPESEPQPEPMPL